MNFLKKIAKLLHIFYPFHQAKPKTSPVLNLCPLLVAIVQQTLRFLRLEDRMLLDINGDYGRSDVFALKVFEKSLQTVTLGSEA